MVSQETIYNAEKSDLSFISDLTMEFELEFNRPGDAVWDSSTTFSVPGLPFCSHQ